LELNKTFLGFDVSFAGAMQRLMSYRETLSDAGFIKRKQIYIFKCLCAASEFILCSFSVNYPFIPLNPFDKPFFVSNES